MAVDSSSGGLPAATLSSVSPISSFSAHSGAHSVSLELRNEQLLDWLVEKARTHQIRFETAQQDASQTHHDDVTRPLQRDTSHGTKRASAGGGSGDRGGDRGGGRGSGAGAKRSRAFALREIGSSRISKGVVTDMKQPVQQMVDSASLFRSRDAEGLWARYVKDGYLYLPKILDASVVRDAHDGVLHGLKMLNVVTPDGRTATAPSGWTVELSTGVVISGTNTYASESIDAAAASIWKSVGDDPAMKSIPRSMAIKQLLTLLAEGRSLVEGHKCEPRMFDREFRWLRVKAKGEMTVEHADEFYYHLHTSMFQPPDEPVESIVCNICSSGDREDHILLCDECGDGCHMDCLKVPLEQPPEGEWFCDSCSVRPTLGTIWVPLEDVPAEHGVLAMLACSQQLSNFTKNYRQSQLPASYFREARGLAWHTTDFAAGDLVIFDSRIVHATSKNYWDSFRLSLDFRWYIAPGRENFGATPHSRFVLNSTEPVTIESQSDQPVADAIALSSVIV